MTSTWPGLTVSERKITMGEVHINEKKLNIRSIGIVEKFKRTFVWLQWSKFTDNLYILPGFSFFQPWCTLGDGSTVWGKASWNVRCWNCCCCEYFLFSSEYFSKYLSLSVQYLSLSFEYLASSFEYFPYLLSICTFLMSILLHFF